MTEIFLIIIGLLLAVFCLYLFAIKGRNGHSNLVEMNNFYYAHRGYHDKPQIPENSLAAFKRAVENGYGAELDVHLLKDGGLAVIHDSALLRTTGANGDVEDLTVDELKNYHLEGTAEVIPTLQKVLDVFDGATPLIIELKTYGNNAAELSKAVSDLLDNYKGIYCLESFDPRCIAWLAKNRPEIMRGQLSCNFLKDSDGLKINKIQAFALTYMLANIKARPDFIAYDYHGRNNLSNVLCRDVWRIATVNWTLKTQEEFDTAIREGALPIFEQFEPS